MAKHGTVDFKGESGTIYTFKVYDRDTNWNSVAAVYFVTRRYQKDGGGYSHEAIYVGETDDLKTRHGNHHREDCFDRNKGNCVCVYMEKSQTKRLEIETDLRRAYNPPCNRQ